MIGSARPLLIAVLLLPLEDQVPENHLLRLVDSFVDFGFSARATHGRYRETGHSPFIDPEFLLRILLIGYLYGVSSRRKLVEELRMHLAWRWFTGLGFDQEVPHHSTFSKIATGDFQNEVVRAVVRGSCGPMSLSRTGARRLSVNGTFVEAEALPRRVVFLESRSPKPRRSIKETVHEYLAPVGDPEPPVEQHRDQDEVSTTIRTSRMRPKAARRLVWGYYDAVD